MRAAIVVTVLALGMGPSAEAGGPIERACSRSDRAAASAELCRCLQRVADATLKRREQRMAASFFRDPDRAQEIRQSDRGRHEAFWQRYVYFGSAAELNCR